MLGIVITTKRINSHSRYTGGCCMYVSKQLNFEIVDCLTLAEESWLLSVKIEKAKEECIFTIVYNSPSGNKNRCIEFFENWCENELDLSKRNVICGDFNIDLMKKTSYASKLQYVIDWDETISEWSHTDHRQISNKN